MHLSDEQKRAIVKPSEKEAELKLMQLRFKMVKVLMCISRCE